MGDKGFADQDRKVLDAYKDMSVGDILKKARLSKNMTIDQVAEYLRIRATYLDALEQNDVSLLPGRVYAIGFVRSYANFLGLDEDKLVYLFKNQKVA